MQGQRSTLQFFPEAFDFDHASGSSSSSLDQQVYWNTVPNPGDTRSTSDYLLSPIEPNMSYMNVFSHEMESISSWNMGAPSSSEPVMNQDNRDASEMENVWAHLSSVNPTPCPRFDERRLVTDNTLSLDSMVIDINSNQISQGQFFPRNSRSTSFPNNVDGNTAMTGNAGWVPQTGICGQVPQTGICPFYNPFSSEVGHPCAIGSSNSHGISTGDFAEDADGRPGSLLDGRRLSGKRKNLEGVPGPSSGTTSSICFQQTKNSLLHNVSSRSVSSGSSNVYSDNLSSVHPPEECLNPRFITGTRGAVPECLSSISVPGSAESSERNFRLRINSSQQADPSVPSLWPLGNSNMNNSVWSPHQPSSLLIPVNQPVEARPAISGTSSQRQHHLPIVPGLPRIGHPCLWNGASIIDTSLNSHVILSERLSAVGEGANLRNLQRNDIPELPLFVPSTEVRHVGQDHTNWGLAHGNTNIPGNVASTSRVGSTSGIHPSISPTWTPHQSPHSQYPQTSSDFVYRAFPAAVSDLSRQHNNFLAQHPGHSGSSEIYPLPGSVLRPHVPPILRSAFLMGRRGNVVGTPLASRTLAAEREGRNMMIYEHIRNALDRMRRGVGVRFEDVLILDQSAIFDAPDMHDRHRDMRLDIDNMSYEELLALEEHIGNVSTGLSEETVRMHLKQRKFLSILQSSLGQDEPCCICQEEYLDGEDLGTLDCGHDFHAACIKQWLTHKNICPICKMMALAT